MRSVIALAALLMMAGCSSSPKTHYYTLSVATRTPQHPIRVSSPVQIVAVHIPDSLDRREMVSEIGPNALDISDQDRWSAPLADMTRNVLSQDLATYLPPGMVVLPDAPAPATTAQIVVSIAQFGPQASGKVVLVGSWSLLKGNPPKPVLRRDVSLEGVRPGTGADADAAGMSNLLGQLAQRIASTLPATH